MIGCLPWIDTLRGVETLGVERISGLIGTFFDCSTDDDRSIDSVFITGSLSLNDETSSDLLTNVSDRFSVNAGINSVAFMDELVSTAGGGGGL